MFSDINNKRVNVLRNHEFVLCLVYMKYNFLNSITDLNSTLHPVKEKVNQLDSLFSSNKEEIKELRSTLGSMATEVNLIREDTRGKHDLYYNPLFLKHVSFILNIILLLHNSMLYVG